MSLAIKSKTNGQGLFAVEKDTPPICWDSEARPKWVKKQTNTKVFAHQRT